MRWTTLICLFLFAAPVVAQEDLNVLKPDATDVPVRKMLHTYLIAEAQKQFDARRTALAEIKTPEDVKKRQQELLLKFRLALGELPDRTPPLNPRVVGKEQRDGYRIEKVVYESRNNHHVTATLYLPDGKGPFPGVLMPIGHSSNGKAADYIQRGSILLAKNGLAVLTYDPIGQGERRQLLDPAGKPTISSSTNEHTLVGIGALLNGESTATYRVWDGIMSLNYLASRPEIDPKRLGCTGCSGGGTMTSYLMALDDRIVAAAPSCYITSLERLFATIGPQDAEQNIPGQVAFGMEHADYLFLRAPKPTLICAATQDFFDIKGTWTSFREAKQFYDVLGHSERVDLIETNTKHGYPKPQREAVTRFMRRWLLDKDDAPVENDFPIAKEADLLCTRTGQVLEEFKGKSVFQLNAEKANELYRQRTQHPFKTENLLKEVRRLTAVPEKIKPAQRKNVGEIKREGYVIHKLIFETEPGIAVPALLFEPEKPEAKQPLLVYLHGRGKAEDAAVGGPIEKHVKAGHRVLALDPRGIGETAPGVLNVKQPSYFGVDFKEAFLGIHLNRPLVGQRIYDVLAVIEAMAKDERTGMHLIGIGSAGPLAIHVAALEPRIYEVTIEQSLASWQLISKMPITYNQLTNVVPGALKLYDLPSLAARIAPRPLTIRNPVDPIDQRLSKKDLGDLFLICKTSYIEKKAEAQFKLELDP